MDALIINDSNRDSLSPIALTHHINNMPKSASPPFIRIDSCSLNDVIMSGAEVIYSFTMFPLRLRLKDAFQKAFALINKCFSEKSISSALIHLTM